MRCKLIAALVPFFIAATPAVAQDGALKIEGSIRTRFEIIDGQFRPGIVDTGAVLIRSILRVEYDAGAIRIGGEIQDARAYFARQPTSIGATEVDTFEPVQAYLTAKLTDRAELQVGRMTMDWGSRRFVSRQNFRNTTNAFTGARFDWQPAKGDRVTLFWTMPDDRVPGDPASMRTNKFELNRGSPDQQFFGARAVAANILAPVSIETYLYRLVEKDSPFLAKRDRRLWTGGLRVLKAPSPDAYDVEFEAAWQGGTARASSAASDTTDLEVQAYFVHASIGRSFSIPWSPRLVISYDRASGDSRDRRYRRFDTLYGARVFEFGPSSLYGLVGRANLSAPEVRVEVKPNKRWDGYAAVRPLWLEDATDSFSSSGLRDASGAAGRYAGTQFDVRARYWLTPDRVRVAAGVVLLDKGRFLETAPRAPSNGDTHYSFVEVTYGF